jgi:hypothetical protein
VTLGAQTHQSFSGMDSKTMGMCRPQPHQVALSVWSQYESQKETQGKDDGEFLGGEWGRDPTYGKWRK